MKKQLFKEKTMSAILGLGGRIRLVRKLLKLSQAEFADKVGLSSHITIYQYEKNLRKPNLPKIRMIALLGNTTIKWILTGMVNEEACDRLIDSIKNQYKRVSDDDSPERINTSFSLVAGDLGVSKDFIKNIAEHKITPSGKFIEKYCGYYDISTIEFCDVLLTLDNIGLGEGISELGGKGTDRKKDKKLDAMIEINRLLMEDEEAQKMVLDILRSRKNITDNTEKLKHKKS